jgi:hypothetical protein
MAAINKADVQEIVAQYDDTKSSVIFSDYAPPTIADIGMEKYPKKIRLADLKSAVAALETKFSNNCNCLENTDCCQTCQSCQGTTCQSCQGSACQSCQSQCYNTAGDCYTCCN